MKTPAAMPPSVRCKAATVRRLKRREADLFGQHLHMLDADCRRMRFGHAVCDQFISDYVAQIEHSQADLFGAFVGGVMRGTGELHRTRAIPDLAEAAFSVERNWRRCGLGRKLLKRLVAQAQNEGITRLLMVCLPENVAMQRLARDFGRLTSAPGEDALILNTGPTPFSVMREVRDLCADPRTFWLVAPRSRHEPTPNVTR